MQILIELLLIGAVTGILSGLFGIGGGVIVVPALAYLFQYAPDHFVPESLAMKMAVASSLMSILFTTLSSAWSHNRGGSLRWDIWKKWIVGLCIGVILGTVLASVLSAEWLKSLFALFLLGVVVKLLAGCWLPSIKLQPKASLLFSFGLGIGVASGLVGVGGGVLMVPILIGLGCSMPESAGTSSASTVPLSIVAGITFALTGWLHGVSIPWSTGYIYWPAVLSVGVTGVLFAPLGAKLTHIIPAVWIKRALAVLLLVIAVHMLV